MSLARAGRASKTPSKREVRQVASSPQHVQYELHSKAYYTDVQTLLPVLLLLIHNSINNDFFKTLHTTGDGSTTTVWVSSMIKAGPSTKSPSFSCSIWNTGVFTRPVSSKYTDVLSVLDLSTGLKSSFSACSKTLGPRELKDLPTPRTLISSTMMFLFLSTKPNLVSTVGQLQYAVTCQVKSLLLLVGSFEGGALDPPVRWYARHQRSICAIISGLKRQMKFDSPDSCVSYRRLRYSSTTIYFSSNPASSSCLRTPLTSVSSRALSLASVSSLSKVSELGSCFSNTL